MERTHEILLLFLVSPRNFSTDVCSFRVKLSSKYPRISDPSRKASILRRKKKNKRRDACVRNGNVIFFSFLRKIDHDGGGCYHATRYQRKNKRKNVWLRTAISSGHDANKYLPVDLVISSFVPQRRSPFINACGSRSTSPFGQRLESLLRSLSPSLSPFLAFPLLPLLDPFTDHVLRPRRSRRSTYERKKQREARSFPFLRRPRELGESVVRANSVIANHLLLRVRSSSDLFQERRTITVREGATIPSNLKILRIREWFLRGRDVAPPRDRAMAIARVGTSVYRSHARKTRQTRTLVFLSLPVFLSTRARGYSRGRLIRDDETRPSPFFLSFCLFLSLSGDTRRLRSPLEPIRREKGRLT